jgi:hypothetical protein
MGRLAVNSGCCDQRHADELRKKWQWYIDPVHVYCIVISVPMVKLGDSLGNHPGTGRFTVLERNHAASKACCQIYTTVGKKQDERRRARAR